MKNDIIVTVVITSHNRKEFLIQAINSVLIQNLVNEECQIIVVKNFLDLKIDKFLHNNSISSLYCESPDLGSKIEYSLQYIKGEIIYFLDDDDTFEPDKIHILTNYFLNNPKIYYIHNNQNIIDPDGRMIVRKKLTPKSTSFNILNLNDLEDRNIIRIILNKKLSFNLSSIAIRREVLVKFKNFLSIVTLRTDLVSLASVIEENKNLMGYTDFPLTNYRIHGNNLSKLDIGNKKSSAFLLNSIKNLLKIKDNSKSDVLKILCDFFINEAWMKLNFFSENEVEIIDYEISLKKLLIEVFLTHRLENISLYVSLRFLKLRPSLFAMGIKLYRFFL